MKYFILLTIFFSIISGNVKAKALDKIIDILVRDPHAREMFMKADTRRKRDIITRSRPNDEIDINNFDIPDLRTEKTKRQMPVQLATTWWSDMDSIGKHPPSGLPWKDENVARRDDIHIFPRHVSSLRNGNIKSNMLGRKHNNQFNNNAFPESPPKEYFQLPPSIPLEGGSDSVQEGPPAGLPWKKDIWANGEVLGKRPPAGLPWKKDVWANANMLGKRPPAGLPWKKDIVWANGEQLGKRGEVIRHLNDLFEVIFGQDKRSPSPASNSISPLKHSKGETSFTIGEKKDSISQLKGGKHVKTWRDRNRITLYKRLIGDLNDLISLEVKKNEGNDTFKVDGISVRLPGLIPSE